VRLQLFAGAANWDMGDIYWEVHHFIAPNMGLIESCVYVCAEITGIDALF
jgi:hypothetical protein